jgi:muconolactone delta-isomerase
MPYSPDTHYVVLNVSPSTTSDELKAARDRAIRLRAYPVPKVMQAFNELRNPRKRAEVDLLIITDLGDEKELENILLQIPSFDFLVKPLNLLSSHPALLRLGRITPETDFLDIPENPFILDGYQPEVDLSILPVNLQLPD